MLTSTPRYLSLEDGRPSGREVVVSHDGFDQHFPVANPPFRTVPEITTRKANKDLGIITKIILT